MLGMTSTCETNENIVDRLMAAIAVAVAAAAPFEPALKRRLCRMLSMTRNAFR